jgi:hypothetical protein
MKPLVLVVVPVSVRATARSEGAENETGMTDSKPSSAPACLGLFEYEDEDDDEDDPDRPPHRKMKYTAPTRQRPAQM